MTPLEAENQRLREQVGALTRGTEMLTAALEEKEREIARLNHEAAKVGQIRDVLVNTPHALSCTHASGICNCWKQALTPPERKP